ncbi:hypothetical protein OB2597_15370 [Pseudooceanicola batsensis HTCC2597]|uniref:Uncharacterized protein n=1 Tax=Pseudooceanicola batsensis (strain ATCC BAA-863 / DSM 15984 / KCTC 12145 / HTCC2597) TaxID=252305 RepID=A3TYV6_PSEBH|nr:hypothetical protein [Pseudooceanicola batsensis]EAQ02774.1 hypothetical protein OB2597_15370 [Pseudooceanicola batsensis HTCC2597]
MLDWITSNANLVSAGVQIVTAAVWIVYLQIFITSYRRQKRSNILINRIAGNADRAHLMVGNMGAEPIYVSAVLVDVLVDGETHCAAVTESVQIEEDREALTNSRQGPLKSAETRDIGALGDITDRALEHFGLSDRSMEVEEITVTVAAEGTYDAEIVAGQQAFWVHQRDDRRIFMPKWSRTRQVRGRRQRKRLSVRLDGLLRTEARTIEEEEKSSA